MEKLDLYDSSRVNTNEYIVRGEKIPKDRYITLVVIFIENSKHEFLLQKQSKEKGNLWTTTGGHVQSGEDSLTAIKREVKEELGLDLNNKPIDLFMSFKVENLFFDMYYLKEDFDIKKLRLQKEEVSEATYLNYDSINSLIENNMFHFRHAKMYQDVLNYLNS